MSSIRLTFSEAECLKLFLPIAKYIREKQMTIIKIKLNAKQIFAITQCNKLLAHGDNSNFMLGCGGKAHLQNDVVEIWGIRGKEIVDLKCGKKHCLALTKCNAVFSWGDNRWGQLGTGDLMCSWKPKLIIFSDIKSIQCGSNHSMALTIEGQVLTWGMNKDGRLGDGTLKNALKPSKIKLSSTHKVVQIACSSFHCLLLTDTGRVFSFGSNQFSQLGLTYYKYHSVPTEVMVLKDFQIDSIACGTQRSVFHSNNGSVFVCGWFNFKMRKIASNISKVFVLDKSIHCETQFFDDIIMMLDSSNSSNRLQSAILWYRENKQNENLKNQSMIDVFKFYDFEAFPELIDIVPNIYNDELFPQKSKQVKIESNIDGFMLIKKFLSQNKPLVFNRQSEETTPNTELLIDTRPEAENNDNDKHEPVLKSKVLLDSHANIDSNVQLLDSFQSQPKPSFMKSLLKNRLAVPLSEIEDFKDDNELASFSFLSTKLTILFDNPLGSDITFHWASGDRIPSHRIVLKNASTKLAKLLEESWASSNISIVNYTFMSFYHFLRYIYTNQIDETLSFDRLLDLMILCHYFQQWDLKKICVKLIKNCISETTCCQLYHLAIKHGLCQMKSIARDFIFTHFDVVEHTEGYMLLPDEEVDELVKFKKKSKLYDSIVDETSDLSSSSKD